MLKPDKGCNVCKHRLLFGCRAFSEIPYAIAEGLEEHDKVRPGQKGKWVFEKEDPKEYK